MSILFPFWSFNIILILFNKLLYKLNLNLDRFEYINNELGAVITGNDAIIV